MWFNSPVVRARLSHPSVRRVDADESRRVGLRPDEDALAGQPTVADDRADASWPLQLPAAAGRMRLVGAVAWIDADRTLPDWKPSDPRSSPLGARSPELEHCGRPSLSRPALARLAIGCAIAIVDLTSMQDRGSGPRSHVPRQVVGHASPAGLPRPRSGTRHSVHAAGRLADGRPDGQAGRLPEPDHAPFVAVGARDPEDQAIAVVRPFDDRVSALDPARDLPDVGAPDRPTPGRLASRSAQSRLEVMVSNRPGHDPIRA